MTLTFHVQWAVLRIIIGRVIFASRAGIKEKPVKAQFYEVRNMTDTELMEFIAHKGNELSLYTMKKLLDLADWYYVEQLLGDSFENGSISLLLYKEGDMSKDPWRRFIYSLTDGSCTEWVFA